MPNLENTQQRNKSVRLCLTLLLLATINTFSCSFVHFCYIVYYKSFIYKSTENPIRRNNNIPCYVVGWG